MAIAKNRNTDRVDPQEAALTMAIAVLVERIRGLSKEDKDDLFELSKALMEAENEEDFQCATAAFREILDQRSVHVEPLEVTDEPADLGNWLTFVSNRIRKAREEAGLTQDALEERTGLPQSHISRLENGVHSPSSATLEKIAQATGKPMSYFDPNHQEG